MGERRASQHYFAGPYLDRRAEAREEGAWLEQALADPATRVLAIHGTAHLLVDDPPRARFLEIDHPAVRSANAAHFTLLGWFQGARCVLLILDAAPHTDDVAPPGFEPGRFQELRPLAATLPADEAGLLAYARALAVWREGHRYCGACGAPTEALRAGHVLRCSACGRQSFPRIDPAIIVLVSDGEHALLGRQHSWPPGRYSTIAGFVEPGESLEDAVRREVREETSIEIGDVAYHSSQPWPFPASLMLGFLARAAEDRAEPHTRDGELEDARWFSRESIATGAILLPPEHSISRHLIEHWLRERD